MSLGSRVSRGLGLRLPLRQRRPEDRPAAAPDDAPDPAGDPAADPVAGAPAPAAADRFAERFTRQWAELRTERRPPSAAAVGVGASNYARGRVPYGVDLAAAWGWRLLVVGAAAYVLARIVSTFSVIVLPLVIALLLSALVVPVVSVLVRWRVPRSLASLLVVVGSLAVVALLLSFAGQQIAQGASNLSDQVVSGLEQIRVWLRTGPLHASDSQINSYLRSAQDYVTSSNREIVSRLTEVGTTLGHIVAGFFIIVFATYFFLADGRRIWTWVVRLFPRASRERADSSGRIAWTSLTSFVRATVLVALTDAVGVMIGAVVLKLPFVIAIGVLVFVGAFVPLIGATLSGLVAILVALVDRGPVIALAMLLVVIGVQQLEAHVLQPFLLGRLVRLHPLGVIVAIAAGVVVAGIAGALVAVPLVAATNAVVLHLADGPRVRREAEDLPVGDAPG